MIKSKHKGYILKGLACLCLSLPYTPNSLAAQSQKQTKQWAEQAMLAGDYVQANAYWDLLDRRKALKGKYALSKALCEFELAFYEESFARIKGLSKKNQKNSIALYLFARLFHLKEQYKEANLYYRQYLHHSHKEDTLRPKAKLYLQQLFSAQNSPQNTGLLSFITENDTLLNSRYDDFGLYRHPIEQDKYFFTRTRLHTRKTKKNTTFNTLKNIYTIKGEEGFWKGSMALDKKYNAPYAKNTFLGFLDNGYQIVYQKDTTVYIDNFVEDNSTHLALPFFQEKNYTWAGDFFFFANRILIFAANTPDGFGAKDIYWSIYDSTHATWSMPENLGTAINSPFDERSPFLANDGQTLYFSRNSPQSIGGYDIFVSKFNPTTFAWSIPEALPKPINSVADDLFFYPQTDGMTAYLSSNRWQTKGGLDFFTVLLAEYMTEQATRKELSSFVDILLTPPVYTVENNSDDNTIAEPLMPKAEVKPIGHYLYPMFYEQNISQSPSAQRNLQTLSSLMTEHKDLQLLISAHAHSMNQSNAYTLFFTMKQAENFANQLISAGVEPNQILMRSGGHLYPIASPYYYDGQANPNAQKLNQRILLNIKNDAELPFQIKNQTLTVGPLMKMPTENLMESKSTGLHYKIQLRKSNTLWRHAILEERKDIVLEQWAHEPTIIYLCGYFDSFAQAQEMLENIQKSYELENPIILPYLDNWRLDEENLYLQLETYPDLKNYLDANK